MRGTQPAGRTYTIGELATMSGATERALRHYEDLGLFSPARDENGYRHYGEKDVERLQQVLLFRACGVGLSEIRELLESPDYDAALALVFIFNRNCADVARDVEHRAHRELSSCGKRGRVPKRKGRGPVYVSPGRKDFGEPRPEEERKMTVSLGTQQDIREMDARGVPRAQISRELGVSRNTVAKYADMGDMSPAAPVSERRPWPATEAYRGWIDGVLEEDLGRPRKQRHTARRIYDRMVSDLGYSGSYSSVCRYVALWRREHAGSSPRDGYLELEWAPGTAQADFGNFRCMLAGEPRSMKLLVVTLPHSNARYCVAMFSERSECLCAGLRAVFEWIGRAPALIVLDNATEAGRMVRGEVTESALFSLFRAHYRCASRYCNPYSGNEKGSVENAVGFLRRNLLVPEPSVSSLEELNALLRAGCDRVNASSRCRDGRPTPEALAEDLAAMLALPGVPFDAVRWARARADKRGYVEACGNRYCAGPAWHGRELVVGLRADSVELLDGRGRLVARLARSWGEGETVRNPASLIPALVARPRAFGESTVRRDMPPELVSAMDRCGQADRRRALRAISRASEASGFGAACAAAARIFGSGRVPDDASCDLLARRIAGGAQEEGGADLAVYDLVARGGEAR